MKKINTEPDPKNPKISSIISCYEVSSFQKSTKIRPSNPVDIAYKWKQTTASFAEVYR